jgi:hypothetical protein
MVEDVTEAEVEDSAVDLEKVPDRSSIPPV